MFGEGRGAGGPPLRSVQVGSLINAAGNFVYAFTTLADRWWMMLLGR